MFVLPPCVCVFSLRWQNRAVQAADHQSYGVSGQHARRCALFARTKCSVGLFFLLSNEAFAIWRLCLQEMSRRRQQGRARRVGRPLQVVQEQVVIRCRQVSILGGPWLAPMFSTFPAHVLACDRVDSTKASSRLHRNFSIQNRRVRRCGATSR